MQHHRKAHTRSASLSVSLFALRAVKFVDSLRLFRHLEAFSIFPCQQLVGVGGAYKSFRLGIEGELLAEAEFQGVQVDVVFLQMLLHPIEGFFAIGIEAQLEAGLVTSQFTQLITDVPQVTKG